MALYNPKIDADYQKALAKLNHAREKGIYIDLTEKEDKTLNQNNYLHLCFSYLADKIQRHPLYVKDYLFKQCVNPDLFIVTETDMSGEQYTYVRSFSTLTKEETKIAIDRWCEWCIEVPEIPMPDPDEYKVCMWLRKDLERRGKYYAHL